NSVTGLLSNSSVWSSSPLAPFNAIIYFPIAEGVCTPPRILSGVDSNNSTIWSLGTTSTALKTVYCLQYNVFPYSVYIPNIGDNVQFGPFLVPQTGEYEFRLTVNNDEASSPGIWGV